ncbi:MAG TPA: EAL domain-containing protein, partial [Chromatiales bacterium]|nr:EAL domain-containing protein [Chromatiales bacterium]
RAIARAILSLGRSLELEVVAEGVETRAQLELLRAEGCGAAQGYLFSPPVPAAELPEVVRRIERAAC